MAQAWLKLMGLKRQARMALSMEDAQRLQQDIRKTVADPCLRFAGPWSNASTKQINLDTLFQHVDAIDMYAFHV